MQVADVIGAICSTHCEMLAFLPDQEGHDVVRPTLKVWDHLQEHSQIGVSQRSAHLYTDARCATIRNSGRLGPGTEEVVVPLLEVTKVGGQRLAGLERKPVGQLVGQVATKMHQLVDGVVDVCLPGGVWSRINSGDRAKPTQERSIRRSDE